MPLLPERPNIEHLKKQAKDLLRLRQTETPELRLQEAQHLVALDYGFQSWRELKEQVAWRNSENRVLHWLRLVYGFHDERPKPVLAARLLAEYPVMKGNLHVAIAIGDETAALSPNAEFPLASVALSTMLQLPEFREGMIQCVKRLLAAGVDPNQAWMHDGHPLSALYGAAGRNHDPELTRILLEAGANPNDNESLYHSLETRDLTCTRLLLEAGATVENVNALHHCLDSDDLAGLRLLLSYTKDMNAASQNLGNPVHWAIKRRRSGAHVKALLEAGADGTGAYRMAVQMGLPGVAAVLPPEDLSLEDQFVGACTRCDAPEAERILGENPDIFARLSPIQLRALPMLAATRGNAGVRLMVRLGWPIAAKGSDLDASALNYAVFNGDSGLTRFLLENGASWTERHRYNDNVHGTLQWASRNHDPAAGDWVGCARALLDHGMPMPNPPGDYSEELAEFMASERTRLAARPD